MADDNRDKGVLASTSKQASRVVRAADAVFWVEYRGDSIELRGGQLLVGRSAMCRLVLDDPLVSRQHAEFRVENGGVVLYDLKSVNGVFVNGHPVERQVRLASGDRVSIGSQELVVRSRAAGKFGERSNDRKYFADTIHEQPERQDLTGSAGPGATESSEDSTIQGEGLDLLATVADKVLALRRGDDAERILTTYLQSLLEKSRQGQTCPLQTAEKAVTYAVKLASITAKASWVNYCIDFYNIIELPLPGAVIDALYDILRKILGVNLTALREYVATLHAVQHRLGPTEKFLVQRIEGLERLAALR